MTTAYNTEDQEVIWNGAAGSAWVDAQPLLDRMLQPFEDLLVAAIPAASSRRLLDVGCGTGSTTLAASRHLGLKGRCTGIDISAPMITAAQARANSENVQATFICADAERHSFPPEGFDWMISRFGVMFFADPIRAFANLRRAAREGAGLHFVSWRSAAENPFMTTAERAAAPLLPNLPARQPDAPGQFALADRHRIQRILRESGWTDIGIQPADITCSFPANSLVPYFTRLGPLGRILPEVNQEVRARVIETVLPAFAPYLQKAEVRFTAACWIVGAFAA